LILYKKTNNDPHWFFPFCWYGALLVF
jgi:hypothetical protein